MTPMQRMAHAIVAFARWDGSIPANTPQDAAIAATMKGLIERDPTIVKAEQFINVVINAYMEGDPTEDMGVPARDLINKVATMDKPKRFQINVLAGKGAGAWECIVRRDESAETRPAFILPPKASLVKP
jgi:hypothetical protein